MTTLSEPRDRILQVATSTSYNGVDFVEVTATRTLVVHFLNTVAVADPSLTAQITGGDSVPSVPLAPVTAADWSSDAEGRPLLSLTALVDGDFSDYRLTITAPKLDLILDSTEFSFKATCPSPFDCAPGPLDCLPPNIQPPPIDYLSRDFQSFRAALLAYSSLAYPEWVERSEADFGLVMAEILAQLGDELSYLQDRVAAEATLPTATLRRSLVSLARLVDYEPQPALSASTMLLCGVGGVGTLAAGTAVSALSPDGTVVPYAIGEGIVDASHYPVSDKWNYPIAPYWFDDSEQCWPAGATDLWVQGHGYGFTAGQVLLIQTDLPSESLRQIVHLTQAGVETVDPIFLTSGLPTPVTHLVWGMGEALVRALDLNCTSVGGNLLPATQGQKFAETFAISPAASLPDAVLAIARLGPNSGACEPRWVYRYPLGQGPLAWAPPSIPGQAPTPQIILDQILPAPATWSFATTLLESLETDTDFTVDPVAWQVIARSGTNQPMQWDIVGDAGDTVRFGDNVFGQAPALDAVFTVIYRTGLGAGGNVARDSINLVAPGGPALLASVRNPFAVTNGADQESASHIERMAPQAFQAVQYRAVTAADYEAAAETLPWVEKAGTSFRWTGSWMTVFTAVDPRGGSVISVDEEISLVELLNRYRLAGYESYAPPPDYLSIDLIIEVCVQTGWLDGDVEESVLNVLGSSTRPHDAAGFFFADRFTFGTPLYRSRLEAAIQGAEGVLGVKSITYRQRGAFTDYRDLPEAITPAPSQILRIDNDPSWPERGVIKVVAEGGR
ncbi:MAG TPA: hypothetical protein VGG68_08830 [Caulobacteraceae bacterium]